MDLQTTFYIMGIIYMSLSLLSMIAMVIAAFYVKHKIEKLEEEVKRKVKEVAAPASIMAGLGSFVVSRALRAFKLFR